jgi:hypothetical protein
MREFAIRIGVFLPMAVFAVIVLLTLIGGIACAMGATSFFYCTVYCKVGMALMIGAIASVLYCQGRACFKK